MGIPGLDPAFRGEVPSLCEPWNPADPGASASAILSRLNAYLKILVPLEIQDLAIWPEASTAWVQFTLSGEAKVGRAIRKGDTGGFQGF